MDANGRVYKLAYKGELTVGDTKIPCFVTEDGVRVLSGRTITSAIGMKGRGQGMARITTLKTLQPFIHADLLLAIENPLQLSGFGLKTYGYEATILLSICEAILKARDEKLLATEQELRYAKYADVLIRAFAATGIIALIDEATGYQEVRDRKALQAILDKYLRKEFAAWAKTFPDEFYKEIFRLKGWPYDPKSMKRPSIIGKYTNDIVYERLAPGILEELKKRNPVLETGRRKVKHHQFLTDDIGHPALAQHLYATIALMRSCGPNGWNNFYRLLQRAFPKHGDQIMFDIMYEE